MDTTIFVGLDVHKKTIAVATVEARASADVRFYGTIPNTPEAIRSMLRKLGKAGWAATASGLRGRTSGLQPPSAVDRAWPSLRRGGAVADSAQGRRQGQDRPPR
jgi:hypothetical protein